MKLPYLYYDMLGWEDHVWAWCGVIFKLAIFAAIIKYLFF